MKVTNLVGHNIGIISDTHFPYHHKDVFDFLEAMADRYDITAWRHTGDINDNHYPSYHELEPGAYDGATELGLAREACKRLEQIAPVLVIAEGNHDALPLRKAKTARIPEEHIKEPNQVFGVGKGWKWVRQEIIRASPGELTLLTHSVGTNARTNSMRFAHNSIQGHHHSEFGTHWYADNASLRWHFAAGCLIDPSAVVFNYNSRAVHRRPIIGCGVLIGGQPLAVPMHLKTNGRWNGKLI